MLDIIKIENGSDLQLQDSIVPKAANVLSVQLGDLEYAIDFGVDLRYFLESPIQFQDASFKGYLVERLTQSQVVVSDVLTTVETFLTRYKFMVGDANKNSKGLIA